MTESKIDNDQIWKAQEQQMLDEGIARSKKQRDRLELSATNAAHRLKVEVIEQVADALTQIINNGLNRKGGPTPKWLKLMQTIDLDLTADLAISAVYDAYHYKWQLRNAEIIIGDMFYGLAFSQHMRRAKQGRRMINSLDKQVTIANPDQPSRIDHIWRKAAEWGFEKDWDDCTKAMYGNILIQAVLHGVTPALFETKLLKNGKEGFPASYIVLTQYAEERIEAINLLEDLERPAFTAMNTKPHDWGRYHFGPYRDEALSVRTEIVKNASREQKAVIDAAIRTGHFDPCLEALNTIQSVPYVINDYVMDALKWLSGDYQNRWKKVGSLPMVTIPPAMARPEREDYPDLTKDEWVKIYRKYVKTKKLRSKAKANRREFRRHQKSAKGISGYEQFWLPHCFDTRGRVYHIPDFGPQNTDYVRAMFLFSEKKIINASNEKWLFHQIANTFGKDKMPVEERRQWAKEQGDTWYRIGKDFKATFEEWRHAKETMQFLAACHDYAQYRDAQAKGESYYSGLPVAQDATCSGTQILAAASLDRADGERVNLTNSAKLGDIYADCLVVAKRMIKEQQAEAEAALLANPLTADELADYAEFKVKLDDEDIDAMEREEMKDAFKETPLYERLKQKDELDALNNIIKMFDPLEDNDVAHYNRSVIKRSVMTYGYSSRAFGFAQQLRDDWMDPLANEVAEERLSNHPFGDDEGYVASTLLGTIHQDAIEEVVKSAEKGMDYFQYCADLLSDENAQLSFETPMGFHFHQAYWQHVGKTQKLVGRDRKTKVPTWGNSVHQSNYRQYINKVHAKNARQAVSPNIVHALDSTLLMMTVLDCKDRNVENLLVIHDSFATHVADAEELHHSVREQFYNLFRGDRYCLFADLFEQVVEQLRVAKPKYLKQLLNDIVVALPKSEQDTAAEMAASVNDAIDAYNNEPVLELLKTFRRQFSDAIQADNELLQQRSDAKEAEDQKTVRELDKVITKLDSKLKKARKKAKTLDEVEVKDIPAKGDLDMSEVLKSQGFFN